MTFSAVAALSACSASGSSGDSGIDGNGSGNRSGSGSGATGNVPNPGAGGPGISLGGQTSGGGGTGNSAVRCDNMLTGVIRDFDPRMHPDFEPSDTTLQGRTKQAVAEQGIVGPLGAAIGPDFKPVYAKDPAIGSVTTYGKQYFDVWFKDTAGINMSMNYTIAFTDADGDGVFTFDAATLQHMQFFPIDDQLLGNWQPWQNGLHNYHFTYELHAKFIYRAGMVFTFSGDDDVWVYVNGRLVVDLGGIHAKATGSVNLDTLGLTPNSEYQLDFFWAERHVAQSNFRIDTSMEFTDCDLDIPR